jgi:hypothetical protein
MKAEYLKSVESGCITLDELREARVELEATNRQVEILSDALAESRREVASIMQLFTDPENQPSQFVTVTLAYMQREIEAEREACAFDAEWCIQNHLEHLIAERIRARGEA